MWARGRDRKHRGHEADPHLCPQVKAAGSAGINTIMEDLGCVNEASFYPPKLDSIHNGETFIVFHLTVLGLNFAASSDCLTFLLFLNNSQTEA